MLNADDEHYGELRALCDERGIVVHSFGFAGEELRLLSYEPRASGAEVAFVCHGVERRVAIGLVGEFQVYNILCALGLVIACGMDVTAAVDRVMQLRGVPGRLERVTGDDARYGVFVDYAHTPNALASVLRTLRVHTTGKLHVVFGCGGDRDRGKRPEMGRVAMELADVVTVTDDNPRSEDPAAIRAEVMAACPDAVEMGDRAEAITAAVERLAEGDILLIAGKGHEKVQIVGDEQQYFDDVEVACGVVQELGS